MAEADKVDLDDFFAKRDKKKKTGKKKDETREGLAKILHKRAEERKTLEEGKSQYVSEDGTNQVNVVKEDDEWLEHTEREVDLTGIKIKELVLDEEEEEEVGVVVVGGGGGGGGVPEGGKEQEVVKTEQRPWRKKDKVPAAAVELAAATPAEAEVSSATSLEEKEVLSTEEEPEKGVIPTPTDAEPEASAVVPPVVSTPAPGGPAKYVPPSMRKAMEASAAAGGGSGGGGFSSVAAAPPPSRSLADLSAAGEPKSAYIPPSRRPGGSAMSMSSGNVKPRKPTTAPNIHDEDYFPSLGAS